MLAREMVRHGGTEDQRAFLKCEKYFKGTASTGGGGGGGGGGGKGITEARLK